MITPSPTGKVAAGRARGVYEGMIPATATRPALVRITAPNTSYELHLTPDGPMNAEVGKRVVGEIFVDGRRVDVVRTGGKFIEPVIGRPQRVQGRVTGIERERNGIVVDCGIAIHLRLTAPGQKAEIFEEGQLVACDVMEGASWKSV